MAHFSGVHGTNMENAEKINELGFTIPDFYPGQSTYGPGIYFYEDDETGRLLAIAWAEHKYGDDGHGTCAILTAFTYNDRRCIWWDQAYEKLVNQWAIDLASESGVSEIQLEEKNELRERVIEYIAQRKGITDPQVVFADFPIRQPELAASHPFQKGCRVMDLSILPNPPYEFVAA